MADPIDLGAILLFHEVVKAGSLSAAAMRSDTPKSTLSRRLQQLEKQLGTPLLKKNTRKQAATDLGLSIVGHCERIATEVDLIQQKAARTRTGLSGTLRVAIPVEFGTAWLGKAIADFANDHPDLAMEVSVSGRSVDLITEPVDLAITFGQPKLSRITQRRLGAVTSGIYASPEYLRRRGMPQSFEEVMRSECVVTDIQLQEGVWQFRNAGRRRDLKVHARIRVNSIRLARELVLDGAGLGLLPHLMCQRHVASGSLVQVLPTWSSPPMPVVALMLSRTSLPKKTRLFLDFVAKQLSEASSD
jgi:DNA-binding transcriptional LysR family regulator